MAKTRTVIHLECECGERNYSKRISKKRSGGSKLTLNKYCSKCRTHKSHKQTK